MPNEKRLYFVPFSAKITGSVVVMATSPEDAVNEAKSLDTICPEPSNLDSSNVLWDENMNIVDPDIHSLGWGIATLAPDDANPEDYGLEVEEQIEGLDEDEDEEPSESEDPTPKPASGGPR